MNLQLIKLEDLKTTAINVRKIGAKDIADLEPSIRSLGLLQPLLVRPNCEGYEVIAGQRRFHALSRIAEDSVVEPVPCIVMAEGDDAKAIKASLAENIARLPMDEIDQYKAFAALVKQGLGAEDIAAQFGITRDLHAIFARLVTLEDSDVTRILTFVVAECLPRGSTMVEALGNSLNVDIAQSWTPDQVFFDLLRDKEAINAMLKDIGGKAVADGNVTSTGKVQKQIIQDYLNGTRKGGKADWHPRYLAVPMAAYTKRGGITAIDQWKAVRKQYS